MRSYFTNLRTWTVQPSWDSYPNPSLLSYWRCHVMSLEFIQRVRSNNARVPPKTWSVVKRNFFRWSWTMTFKQDAQSWHCNICIELVCPQHIILLYLKNIGFLYPSKNKTGAHHDHKPWQRQRDFPTSSGGQFTKRNTCWFCDSRRPNASEVHSQKQLFMMVLVS